MERELVIAASLAVAAVALLVALRAVQAPSRAELARELEEADEGA